MTNVNITVEWGGRRYSVELENHETNAQAWGLHGSDHIDSLVDAAVADIKRAYHVEKEE